MTKIAKPSFFATSSATIQTNTDASNTTFINKSKEYNEIIYGYWHSQMTPIDFKKPEKGTLAWIGDTMYEDLLLHKREVFFKSYEHRIVNPDELKKVLLDVNIACNLDGAYTINEKLDDSILFFCLLEDLTSELHSVYSLIKLFFANIHSINIQLYSDPEIECHKQIVLEVFIKDAIKNILNMEEKFYNSLVKSINKEKLKYFTLKCEKYEA